MCKSVTMLSGLLVLTFCGITVSENKYGDYGIVMNTLPLKPVGYMDIVVLPATPDQIAPNFTGELNGMSFNDDELQFLACDVDYDMNYIYLYDFTSRNLVLGENWNSSALLSEMKFTIQHYGISSDFVKIAVDWVSHNIYWTEPLMAWIAMQPGGPINDTTLYKVIVNKGLEYPVGIAVDPIAGYLFWTDNGQTPKIQRSDLIGGNIEVLVSNSLLAVYSIVADPASQRIFWTAYDSIDSISYEGAERKHIRRSFSNIFFDVALFEDVIMPVDMHVFFFNKTNGSTVVNAYASDMEGFVAICMYHTKNQPPGQDRCKSHGCQHICVNEPTKTTCLCKEGFNLNDDGKTCTEAEGKHYRGVVLNTGQELCIVDIRVLVDHHDFMPTCFYNGTENENITHIDLNMKTREVYFSVKGNIYRVKIDGGPNTRTLLTQQEKNITGLSFDWVNNHLYYSINETEGIPDSIWLMDPDTGFTQKHQNETADSVRGLVVVPHEGKVFWLGNKTEAALHESNLGIDPGSMKVIDVDWIFDDPVTVIHDRKKELLYVLDVGFFRSHSVIKIYYNGSYDSYLRLGTTVHDIDVYKEYLVFLAQSGEDTILHSIDLTVSYDAAEGKVKGLKNVYGIKVLDPGIQTNYPSPCGKTAAYGGCEQICIPDGDTAVCDCTLGFDLHEDGTSCTSEPVLDNFLLVADDTYDRILQIPLNEPNRAIGIKTPDISSPEGVFYNYLTDKVVWANSGDLEIMTINLDGSNATIMRDTFDHFAYPDQFALDPSTGNIYYTADSILAYWFDDSFVGVIDPKGQHLRIHHDNQEPRGIALHPEKGQYYMTESGENPAIVRADMDGSNFERLITDVKLPYGIAIDYDEDRLYWTDGFLNKIFSSDLDGGDRIEVLLEDKDTTLLDIVLLGDYLYYSAKNKTHVTKVHKLNTTDRTDIGPVAGLGVINGLAIYNKEAIQKIPKNKICSENNGGCSDLCLPTSKGATCACDEKYELLSDGRTCENAPRCPMLLSNGIVKDSDTCLRLPGNKCNFTCVENYRIKPGVTLITCTDEELEEFDNNEVYKWDDDEPCEEIFCTATPPNAFIDEECERSVGAQCEKFTCAPGYERNTSLDNIKCLKTGEWDIPEYMCLERCPHLEINTHNANLITTCVREPGEDCQFLCNHMYTNALQYNSIRCLSGSRWNVSTARLCKEILCPDFFQSGFVNTSCSRKDEAVCSFECMDRYQPNPKTENIKCDKGVWVMKNQDLPCQKVPVPPVEEKSSAQDIGIGIGIGAGVILLVVILIIVCMHISRKTSSTKSYDTSATSQSAFENPRYMAGDESINNIGQESNKDFGYTTLTEDTVRVTN